MKTILLVDDDKIFCNVLQKGFAAEGYEAKTAHDSATALELVEEFSPEYVVLDLNIAGESGLALLPKLLAAEPFTKIVVLTGNARVNTAVEAIKLGAVHYLSKPVDVKEIIEAFEKTEGNPEAPIYAEAAVAGGFDGVGGAGGGGLGGAGGVGGETIPLGRMEQNYILATLEKNKGNISATARELKMHRRTLQRKLDKNF